LEKRRLISESSWSSRVQAFLWKADVPLESAALKKLPNAREKACEQSAFLSEWKEQLAEFFDCRIESVQLIPVQKQGSFHIGFEVHGPNKYKNKTEEPYFLKSAIPGMEALSEDFTFEPWLDTRRGLPFVHPETLHLWGDPSRPIGRLMRWVHADSFFTQAPEHFNDTEWKERYRLLGLALGEFSRTESLFPEQGSVWGWFSPQRTQSLESELSSESDPGKDSNPILQGHPTWESYFFSNLESHWKQMVDAEELDRTTVRGYWNWMESSEVASLLSSATPALLHGDLGNPNVYHAEDNRESQIGIIDWEDRLIGDPLFEVAGWATFFRMSGWIPSFWEGYCEGADLKKDQFEELRRRFWLYFWRISLAKSVHRLRFGYTDPVGAAPAICRVLKGFAGWSGNADFTDPDVWKDPQRVK
jgi:hypothetical protein